MRKVVLCAWLVGLLACRCPAQISFNFEPASETGMQGDTISYFAALTNYGSTTLTLDAISVSGTTDLNPDTDPFFDNTPDSLDPGQVWYGNVFNIQIGVDASPGSYSNSATVLYGGQYSVSQTFLTNVVPGEGLFNEPRSLVFLLFGVTVVARRKKR